LYFFVPNFSDENDNYKINEDIFRAMWMLGMQIDKKVVLKQFAYLGVIIL
jgi:hypothetical protein